MSQHIDNAIDKIIIQVLSKIELNKEQDGFLRFLLRDFFLEAFDEGEQDGYEEGRFDKLGESNIE